MVPNRNSGRGIFDLSCFHFDTFIFVRGLISAILPSRKERPPFDGLLLNPGGIYSTARTDIPMSAVNSCNPICLFIAKLHPTQSIK
jgi:hypothetical protein